MQIFSSIRSYLEWNSCLECCTQPAKWWASLWNVHSIDRPHGSRLTLTCLYAQTAVAIRCLSCLLLASDLPNVAWYRPKRALAQFPVLSQSRFCHSCWNSFDFSSDSCSASWSTISSKVIDFRLIRSDHRPERDGKTVARENLRTNPFIIRCLAILKMSEVEEIATPTFLTLKLISQCCGNVSVVHSRALLRSSSNMKNELSSVNWTMLSKILRGIGGCKQSINSSGFSTCINWHLRWLMMAGMILHCTSIAPKICAALDIRPHTSCRIHRFGWFK